MELPFLEFIVESMAAQAGGFCQYYRADGAPELKPGSSSLDWPCHIDHILQVSEMGAASNSNFEVHYCVDVHGFNYYIYPLQANSGWLVVAIPTHSDLGTIMHAIPVGIIKLDSNMRLLYTNEYCTDMLGVGIEDLAGSGWLNLFDNETKQSLMEVYLRQNSQWGVLKTKAQVITPLGKKKTLSLQLIPQYQTALSIHSFNLVISDITTEYESVRELTYLVNHDSLTRLANREFLVKSIQDSILNNRIINSVLVFIDLDDFKPINDSFGHRIGDEILKIVANRLLHATRSDDIVARLGGDEFVIFAKNIESIMDVMSLTQKIKDKLTEKIHFNNVTHRVDASIGVARHYVLMDLGEKEPVELASEWLKMADMAMYKAKEKNHGIEFYDEDVRKAQAVTLSKKDEIRQLISDERIKIVFQPVMVEGCTRSVEVLSRFPSSKHHNNIEEIIETAQHHHYAPELFKLMLSAGIQEFARLLDALASIFLITQRSELSLHINVDAVQFSRPDIATYIIDKANAYNLLPQQIYIEITEQALFISEKNVERNFMQLKDAGFRLSMDDFGTGYSSFQRLMHYPFDELKIDRYFTSRIHQSRQYKSAVDAMVSLAKSMDMALLAEGVETKQQFLYMQSLGVQAFQGFYFSKPLSADCMIEYLHNEKNQLKRVRQ